MNAFMSKFTIGTRLGVGFALVVGFLAVLIVPLVISELNATIEQAEERELRSLFDGAEAEIASEGRLATAASQAIALLPPVERAMAARDRRALENLTLPVFQTLHDDFGVRQFQFHTPPATSFLRVHMPDRHGDDLSGFRQTVIDTNRNRQTISGLERGVAGLGVRGIAPISYQGEHQGSVEFGMTFGQDFFDRFKDQHNVEIGLYLEEGGRFEPFATTLSEQFSFDSDMMQNAMAGQVQVIEREVNGAPHTFYARHINDFSGEPVGVMTIGMDREAYLEQMAQARNKVLGVVFIGVLIATAIGFLITISITRPIKHTARAMADIAEGEGDLTRQLDASGKDEVAELADGFNRFAGKMRESISHVSQSTDQLSAAAEELSQVTNDTNDGVQRQQQETEMVATAMNEMTTTVQDIAQNATQAAEATQDADSKAREGDAVVDETVSQIRGLADEIEHAASVIGELEQSSDKISSVVDVIQGIAEQTNLLALNAAIEAARAGEQGRGFAVVAEEVRALATRTQESTTEIQGMIESIQGSSKQAVAAMNTSRDHAQKTAEQADQAGDALEHITAAIGNVTDMTHQIASAAEEQGQVAEEINRNVVNINEAASQTSEGGKQTQIASEELAQLASKLQKLVGQFKC